MATVEEAGRVARKLPEVTEGVRHGNLTWFVGGKAFAWERPFSKADLKRFGVEEPPPGPIFAVRTLDLDDKQAVLAEGRKGFFTIPHFDGYAAVLIQLEEVGKRDLEEAIVDGWLACASSELAERFLSRRRRKRE